MVKCCDKLERLIVPQMHRQLGQWHRGLQIQKRLQFKLRYLARTLTWLIALLVSTPRTWCMSNDTDWSTSPGRGRPDRFWMMIRLFGRCLQIMIEFSRASWDLSNIELVVQHPSGQTVLRSYRIPLPYYTMRQITVHPNQNRWYNITEQAVWRYCYRLITTLQLSTMSRTKLTPIFPLI
jgi:hypothetical protein